MNRTTSVLLTLCATSSLLFACTLPGPPIEKPKPVAEAGPKPVVDAGPAIVDEPKVIDERKLEAYEDKIDAHRDANERKPPKSRRPLTCAVVAAHVMSVADRDDITEESVAGECEQFSWMADTKQCLADSTSAADIVGCSGLLLRDLTTASLHGLEATLTAVAAANECYAGSEGFQQQCEVACDDGFADACHRVGRDIRSCDLGMSLRYAPSEFTLLDAASLDRELGGAQQACEIMARPLVEAAVADSVPTDDQAKLYSFAGDACELALQLDPAASVDVCADFLQAASALGKSDDMNWALERICEQGEDACLVAFNAYMGSGNGQDIGNVGNVDIGDDWFWPGL